MVPPHRCRAWDDAHPSLRRRNCDIRPRRALDVVRNAAIASSAPFAFFGSNPTLAAGVSSDGRFLQLLFQLIVQLIVQLIQLVEIIGFQRLVAFERILVELLRRTAPVLSHLLAGALHCAC